jgi:hypothetical protein
MFFISPSRIRQRDRHRRWAVLVAGNRDQHRYIT